MGQDFPQVRSIPASPEMLEASLTIQHKTSISLKALYSIIKQYLHSYDNKHERTIKLYLIFQFGQAAPPKKLTGIDIEFVRVRRALPLKGFSGRKKNYVNADHFLLQYKYDNPSPPPLELLQLDSFTLIFHESIHTTLRDTENNYPGRALRLPETVVYDCKR
ncbi:unnamed protein product [Rotaria magnacalcarata]|uniref:Uncharacterized protein n=2 Tax=Rotaria magnacalcarata TaxID=392030 RepID=A0A816WYK4_9BILA|nr:unnamed protein product [Rotaria magnacalcarata]CAF3760678.1 unnamed protein product [Rotaria magnacalcarata]